MLERSGGTTKIGWPSGHTLAALVFLGVAVALVVGQTWLYQHVGVLSFLVTPGWLLWLWGVAKSHSEWLTRHSAGMSAWILNRDVQWDSQIVLYGVSNSDAPAALKAWLLRQYTGSDVRVIPSDEDHTVVQLPFGTVVIKRTSRSELSTGFADPETVGSSLVVDIQNVGSGYRRAVSLAKTHLKPFLQELAKAASPARTTYVLKARFPNGNPHWGLYVRLIGQIPNTTVRFDVSFNERVGPATRTVRVTQDQLTVSSNDPGEFMDLVQTHLAFV